LSGGNRMSAHSVWGRLNQGGWHCSDRHCSDSYILLPMHMMFPRLPVPPFPPLRFGPTFSSPDFSSPAFSAPPPFIMYVYACTCLTASHAPSPMSCAKTTEPIEMPYGVCTLIGPINHVFGGSGSPTEMDTVYKTYFGTPWLAHDDTVETI